MSAEQTAERQPGADMFGLAGKVCVVTGAGGGIGRAIAETLAAEGAIVAVIDWNEATAGETAARILSAGGRAIARRCDTADHESVQAAHSAVLEQAGAATVLVNCVGLMRRGALDAISPGDWREGLSVNLTGYFLCSQVFGKAMLERGHGALVHVSSIQGTYPSRNAGAYSTAKAGVDMLSRQLALEWGRRGVRSNVVHPAWVETPMSAQMYAKPAFRERRSGFVPCRRIGQPEDIAQAVLFLASDRASYVNGAELLVDGGLSANVASLLAP